MTSFSLSALLLVKKCHLFWVGISNFQPVGPVHSVFSVTPTVTWDQLVKTLQSRSLRASFTGTKKIGLEEYHYILYFPCWGQAKNSMILGGIAMNRWSIANVLTWLPYPIYSEIFVRSWGSSMYPGLLQLADSKFYMENGCWSKDLI